VDFCRSGGEIVERFCVPLGSGDFGGVIAALPENVEAIYLGVRGTDPSIPCISTSWREPTRT
jgi:branched-chain amino acid transport system substrate-binding protein